MRRRTFLKTISGGAAAIGMPGLALSQIRPLKIGLVTDYTGIYRDYCGPGEEYGIQMAIHDFNKGSVLGRPIELLTADHHNKADTASGIAKRWLEVDKIDMLVPGGSSSAALSAHILARENGIIAQAASPAAQNFTEKDCSPLGFHWQVDSYATSRASVLASGEQARKKWFFITLDNVFGHATASVCTAAIQEAGGQVLGNVKHPINTTDFASFILQAQASRADVVAFLSAGSDLVRALKQAREFGIQKTGQFVVAPIMTANDIQAVGLDTAQDMQFADGFYWNVNDATRAFAKRFQDKIGRAPSASHAQVYAAVTHYLQAIAAVKSTEGKPVAAQMKKQPITQQFWRNAYIRSNGRVVYDLNTMRVKTVAQSKGQFDIAELLGTLSGDKVFKPLNQTECKFAV